LTNFVTQETTRFVTEGEIRERNLSWSADANALLYTAQTEELPDYVENIQSENWHVSILNPDTNETTRVENALYGDWIGDSEQFVFARKDGLYLYDLETATSTRVLLTDWEVSAQDMFDLSDDGKYLAWAIPGLNQLRLYELVSSEDFIVEEKYRQGLPDKNYY